jgi:hypothetical protein
MPLERARRTIDPAAVPCGNRRGSGSGLLSHVRHNKGIQTVLGRRISAGKACYGDTASAQAEATALAFATEGQDRARRR